jgi:hypothetical protein
MTEEWRDQFDAALEAAAVEELLQGARERAWYIARARCNVR